MSNDLKTSVSEPTTFRGNEFHKVWDALLHHLVNNGRITAPRGLAIREQLNVTVHVERGNWNILHNTARNLGYRAMVAEWLWIAGGFNDLKSLAQYNKRYAEFSDDGITLYGAYGPRIRSVWHQVKTKLIKDGDTRQAIISIWGPETRRDTKDTPCTLSLQFFIRDNKLHLIVNMRSSDVWLGLPNDFYVFSQLLNQMSAEVESPIGSITMNLGSSHLYESNLEAAQQAFNWQSYTVSSPQFIRGIVLLDDLYERFKRQSGESITVGGKDIWDLYAKILVTPTRQEALILLKEISKLRDD